MPPQRQPACRPHLEVLEGRIVPYALSGYKWADPNVSASFMPDGTSISSHPSNLFATYDPKYPRATWQLQFARALQTWAAVTPLNFHFVADDGSPSNTPGLTQGDSRFGDIRLGAYPLGYSLAYTFSPVTGVTLGGDVTLSSSQAYNIGATFDLYSILLHETGLALGLNETSQFGPVMNPTILGVYTGLSADDTAGIQAIYGPRRPDAYDAQKPNDTLTSPTPLTLNSSGAATVRADLSSLADVDNYQVTVPAGHGGNLTVTLDARGLS